MFTALKKWQTKEQSLSDNQLVVKFRTTNHQGKDVVTAEIESAPPGMFRSPDTYLLIGIGDSRMAALYDLSVALSSEEAWDYRKEQSS
jgi:hypothetical protein